MKNEREEDFKNVLQDPELGQEIGPDELAVHAAGLTHPDDLELENIISEIRDSESDYEVPEESPEDALNRFLSEEEPPATNSVDPSVFAAPTQAIPTVGGEDFSEEVPLEDFETEDSGGELDRYEEKPAPPSGHKSRPKWKKGYGLLGIPHIVSTAIWLAITVLIGVSLGRILWVCCADVMAFGKPEVTAYITVTDSDDIETISQKLADASLIRYPGLFQKFAEITKKDDRIQTGVYELSSHLDYNAMINNMVYTSISREEVEITFPEGYNCAQTFRLLEANGVCSVEDLEAWAADGELDDYWFLESVERGDKYCLEGYLAPDTYRFYTNDEPRNVLEKFLDAFDTRFTDIMRDDLQTMQERYATMLANGGYSEEYIQEHPLTLHDVLTVASVIERETANDAESYDIASVFYNRVTDPDIGTMGSDATVYYALGDYFREKDSLTESDLNVDSPYNTRKVRGIPPGPICNPGAYSLYAALDPNDTEYHYFIYDASNGQHLFSVTYDEHMQKVNELSE